ncbi:hypothetical protein HW555_008868, partial [Spodoptera exigua]
LCNVSYAQYQGDATGRIKDKLDSMCRELVVDASMKIAAVQSYRREYARAQAYQIGDMMFYMRNVFKKMTVIYQLADKEQAYRTMDSRTWFYQELHKLYMHANMVDTMLNIIKSGSMKRETKEMMHQRMNSALRSGQDRKRAPGRAPSSRAPQPRAPAFRASTRKNQKWRHVVDEDFV